MENPEGRGGGGYHFFEKKGKSGEVGGSLVNFVVGVWIFSGTTHSIALFPRVTWPEDHTISTHQTQNPLKHIAPITC